ACSLLHRLGLARRALVVTPASLKTEWEEQIQRFTDLPYQLVFGQRHQRLKSYTLARSSRREEAHSLEPTRRAQNAEQQSQSLVTSAATDTTPFFTIVTYEQMLRDALDVNARLRPDIVVLDEAQRIKNSNTKTA